VRGVCPRGRLQGEGKRETREEKKGRQGTANRSGIVASPLGGIISLSWGRHGLSKDEKEKGDNEEGRGLSNSGETGITKGSK